MTSVQQRFMTVGELSRRTGVPIKNLRQYTDWGLIYSVGRSGTGYRLFDSDALWCVEQISTLRGLGLTLAEIRELSRRRRAGPPIGPLLAQQLHVSRARIEARIAELRQTLSRIGSYVETHQAELTEPVRVYWAGDPRCEVSA
ncbi:MAG: MerR family transcriptional regulator [Actinomycetota bacterium]|nr:MerR family transcriptional regulator [Actinomycetota bacterium]